MCMTVLLGLGEKHPFPSLRTLWTGALDGSRRTTAVEYARAAAD